MIDKRQTRNEPPAEKSDPNLGQKDAELDKQADQKLEHMESDDAAENVQRPKDQKHRDRAKK